MPRTKQNLTLRVTSPTSDFGQNCQPKEVNISQALDLAAQEYNAGSLHEAENIYQQILQADPDNPSALQILGVIAYQGGRLRIAFDIIPIQNDSTLD